MFASASKALSTMREGSAADWAHLSHPYMYVSSEPVSGLRTADQLRADLARPPLRRRVDALREQAHAALDQPVLTRHASTPSGQPVVPDNGEPIGWVMHRLRERLLDGAFLTWLDGDVRVRDHAVEQLLALCDPERCLPWGGSNPPSMSNRGGSIARMVGMAYDWLAPSMTDSDRQFVIDAVAREAFTRMSDMLAHDRYPTYRDNNMCSSVVGGVGVAALATLGEHADAPRLAAAAFDKVRYVIDHYGPEGEFNESPGYTDAVPLVVQFMDAWRHITGDHRFPNRLTRLATWLMRATSSDGVTFNHGDSGNWTVRVGAFLPLASASRDGVLQWFFEKAAARPDHMIHAEDVVGFDPSLVTVPPAGRDWPLGRAYRAHGGLVDSRSSWTDHPPACEVAGKSSIEPNHEHNDAGQLVIRGRGQRLVDDFMSHSYPPDYWEPGRYGFVFSQAASHNVLTFGDYVPPYETLNATRRGRLIDAHFDDRLGGWWRQDLSEPLRGIEVTRTVLHLLPGIVAVLDEASADRAVDVSLRWHLADRPTIEGDTFSITRGDARLSAKVIDLAGGALTPEYGTWMLHPLCRARTADGQAHFVAIRRRAWAVRWLTLFAVDHVDTPLVWSEAGSAWVTPTANGEAAISMAKGVVTATLADRCLQVRT